MNELKLIPFKAEHFLQYSKQENIILPVAQQMALGEFYEKSGPSFTALLDSRPIASAGLRFIQPGVGEVWAYVSESVSRVKKQFHRHAKETLVDVIRAYSLRRVQAGVLVSAEPKFGCWLRALGFANPVLLEAFGPNGEDFLLYSIIRRN